MQHGSEPSGHPAQSGSQMTEDPVEVMRTGNHPPQIGPVNKESQEMTEQLFQVTKFWAVCYATVDNQSRHT